MNTFSQTPDSSSADIRVPIVLTVLFWPALVALIVFSPSLLVALIACPGVFAVYFLALIGYGLIVDARDRRDNHAPLRRQRHPRLSHGLRAL